MMIPKTPTILVVEDDTETRAASGTNRRETLMRVTGPSFNKFFSGFYAIDERH